MGWNPRTRNLVGPPLAKRDRRAGNAGDEQIQMLTAKLLLCRDWISVKSPSAKIKEVNYSASSSTLGPLFKSLGRFFF